MDAVPGQVNVLNIMLQHQYYYGSRTHGNKYKTNYSNTNRPRTKDIQNIQKKGKSKVPLNLICLQPLNTQTFC